MKNCIRMALIALVSFISAGMSLASPVKVKVAVKNQQAEYAATLLSAMEGKYTISIKLHPSRMGQPAGVALLNYLPEEGFELTRKGRNITVTGYDGSGCIYGVNRLLDYHRIHGNLDFEGTIADAPEMKLRGTCVGMQKVYLLPGHRVYEYPYTPENFPWFYDKDLWIKYLDMLASDNMNTLYLWNGHPFASLVKLDDYPFAAEVDDATMQLNQDMFTFLTEEAGRRGIRVIQMFYNIILSKPFADHYGLKTQDRNRPITPLISDYTRKSIAAFIEKYPNVGLLVCLGEAMSGIDTDIKWMTETVIPGIKDGLKASGRTDTPPIILRSHDTDCPKVLEAALPLYPNINTMSKYTGESLTTYEPGGPWGETHRMLSSVAPIHVSNVHVLANLEPWRWSSPLFIKRTVGAMHRVHGANGLHLYPQASYWDWPYTADKIGEDGRQLQIDRDWMWYRAWGRYTWKNQLSDINQNPHSIDYTEEDRTFWLNTLSEFYGCDSETAALILEAYDESGEIAPKLLRRFGITEGNRQTLLLGMKMSELVNPYKYTIYPGFYESCGPKGEKLIEYVEKQWKHQAHEGEMPLDIVNECQIHGQKAVAAIDKAEQGITRNKEEFSRLRNDMHCYSTYAEAFRWKVLSAEQVLNFKWSKDVSYLRKALPLLEKSDECWNRLVALTENTYYYANSMQTSMRRIPVGGDNGTNKTWKELKVVYDAEREALVKNIAALENPDNASAGKILNPVCKNANVKLDSPYRLVKMEKGARLFENRDEVIDSVCAELKDMDALLLNRDTTRIKGATIEFTCEKPVTMLVGFFIDDQNKFAAPPKLEIDASANEYGQAEAVITGAISMTGMPAVNIHPYHFEAGHHVINLPRGIIMVAGFTETQLTPRDAGLGVVGDEVDWLFM